MVVVKQNWFSRWLSYQWADMKSVRPYHSVSVMSGKFIVYLNSPAGLIKYSTKTEREFTKFRDIFVNRFERARKRKEFFALYREIKKKYRVSYSANARTRFQGLWC